MSRPSIVRDSRDAVVGVLVGAATVVAALL
jgi:hypothetical protein